jgi:hypothetical protein
LRKLVLLLASVGAALLLAAGVALAVTDVGGPDGTDDRVTSRTYVRHDGGTDAGIRHCKNSASNPAEDSNPDDSDADSNDGGNLRQDNEPYSVVDPTDPDTVVAGWNDYCLTDLGAGWEGFGFSRDGGETWKNSLVPGYPQDDSVEGRRSPLFGDHTDAGDPIAAFDNAGRLYVGGISFNSDGAINGDVFVATYGAQDQPNGYPVDYLRTRVVGKGTPSRNFQGIFQDKPMLEVDRTGGPDDGNVYVCWSRFTGLGQNKIYFSRSTDQGQTFSRPVPLTTPGSVGSVQGCDIAVEADGDVYVTYRTFATGSKGDGLAFNRSTDGGASFTDARLIRNITEYFPSASGQRDCGDGDYLCPPSEFVFHRVPLEPRVTSDQSGDLPGVYLTFNQVRPGSIEPSENSYSSAGSGRVGQSLIYVVRTTNNGRDWSRPRAVNPRPRGHQFFSDIDAFGGEVAVVWQDSRTDPAYSVQRPIGNTAAARSPLGTNEVNSFFAHSTNGTTWSASTRVSSEGHQSQYEMFGDRNIPFHGDYNWISLANTDPEDPSSPLLAYMSWTDNRDVVPGTDPREDEQDRFDVKQCRVDLGEDTDGDRGDGPLARRDQPYSGDNCANGGGLNQNIYGNSLLLP